MAKKLILSPEQDCAANPLENVWVQANAGTGKTKVLVRRLLRILFRSPDMSSTGILCLTYTNAGAGEMRNRILSDLREWATADDDELIDLLDGVAINTPATHEDIAHARQIFFRFIDSPELLKIKTIHGFCEEVLRRFPIEAGVSPSWSLVSDSAQRVLLGETFTKLINSPSNGDRVYAAFEHIVNRVSENYLNDLMGILSNQYKQFFGIENIVKYREYFIETTRNFLELNNCPNTDIDVPELKKIIELATLDKNSSKKPVKYLDDIINITQQYIDTTADFEKYKELYLTRDGTKKTTIAKKDYLVAEQDRVYNICQYYANTQLFNDTMSLFDLSAAFAQEYQHQKNARNLLDFEDLILYTRKLFSNSATMGWVLSQLDVSLSHILVDEAQDTSPIQWDILRMLSGDFFTDGNTDVMPHSIFVVGDTKQSIYGFQGADPRAFADSRAAIAAQIEHNYRTIREIPLAQSFRSTQPILATVDRFFSDTSVIAQSGFANNAHKCFRTDAPGAVELHKLISKQETNTGTAEYIAKIADKIQSLVSTAKYKPHDIMVLVQQRNPMASPLVSELKRRNIDVAGSDRIILPEFPAIRDLLNLVRWCLNTADDYSLCCVLKSPIFRLNEQNIFNLCKIRNNTNLSRRREDSDAEKITVYDVLKDTMPDIAAQLASIHEWASTMSPYSFFINVLNQNNTRNSFIAAIGAQAIDPLDEFMTICLSYERTQPGTLKHFLKWFITGGSEIKRDMDASSGVRIVTVHGSKGLEAPVVFLIDTVHMPRPDKIIPIVHDDMPVWLWSPHGDISARRTAASDAMARTRMAEYYRLLYVAMTRARDELYIYGYTPYKNAPDASWHNMLWTVLAGNTNAEYIRITNDDIA